MNEIGEIDGKPLTLDLLTSDSWEEFESKLKRTKWKQLFVILAERRNHKIIVNQLIPIEIEIEVLGEDKDERR